MTTLIVEGPDGAGKTTLIKELAPKLSDARVIHHGAYLGEKHIAQHYRESLYRALLRPRRSVILDRAWLAEPIYGRAKRNGLNRIAAWERRSLERLALRAGAVVVLCLPSFSTCERAWKARQMVGLEYLQRREELRQVHDGYRDLSLDVGLPVFIYNYERHRAVDVLAWLEKQPTPPPVKVAPGLGRFAPKEVTLLVGEEMNSRHALDLPFVSASRGGSGPWLANQLETWGVPERDLYWVNAYHAGVSQPLDFLGALKPKSVIALGRVAELRLREAGVKKYTTVPHPQFWKRFHHHEEYPLKEALCTTSP